MAIPNTQIDQGFAEELKARGFGFLYSDAPGVGAKIFVGEEEPSPDRAITVVLEGSGPGGVKRNISESYAMTLRFRDSSYELASGLAFSVFKDLVRNDQGKFGGALVARASLSSSPVPLGRDEATRGGRWLFSLPVALLVKANDT